ncbi:hypothetical protein FHS95_001382 [Sphingomonas naasensis]|uniref:Hemerythrin domain-containing protein n=1 Tax=Sphingomonas naasensis TaxID=1344951 RepID=A0A4S1WB31_9SPHN|nr:hypothetical protein [Sphingomonas naasensis]NIJ19713.1 hypothetical protein [Sphingomonas naasensis]TGX40141.1 hypothetical protein E5A74_16380 [Sphingomonas naasensis]
MTVQDLYEDHRELFRIGEKLIEIASSEPPRITALIAARREMAQAVARHLGNEARLALMPLGASGDPYDRALARRYTSDLLAMRQSGIAHMGQWTMEAILADPREYRLAVRGQIRMMAARREWEETEFLPAAERLAAGQREPLRAVG